MGSGIDVFGRQLRKRRRILGLTQQDVVDGLAGRGITITKAALSKYETGKSVARSTVFHGLCKVLECSPDYLLSPEHNSVEWLRFRKKASLGKHQEERVKEAARQWLDARLFVEEILGTPNRELQLPDSTVSSVEEGEAVASAVRKQWGLGTWPIESISSAMERSGVYVVEIRSDREVDGISGVADETIPFVVVSRHVPTDRMRMNLAHELGHTVIKPTDDEKFDERVAFRFAGALLIPDQVMFDRLGRKRNQVDLREFVLVKQEYGISIQALIRRCFDLGIVTEWTYRQLNVELRSVGWHRDEPGECNHRENSSQLKSSLIRCLAEGLVTESRIQSLFPEVAKELGSLGNDAQWQWKGLRQQSMEDRHSALAWAAERAQNDYAPGGSLSDLELIDDE